MTTDTRSRPSITEEDRASPAPWSYHTARSRSGIGERDWIEDNDGNIVIENVGGIDGPRICRAVNELALREGILT